MAKLVLHCKAEFVGGPLDGELQEISLPAETFLGVAVFPDATNHGLLRRWFRKCFARRRRTIRLAIYEFDDDGGGFRYRHLRTVVTSSTDLSRLGRIDRNGQVPIANSSLAER